MSLPVRRAKLRLEEKSKKVQDVIQRLRSRVCTLESMQDSLLTELMEEKANLISAIHSVENSVLGKIYDAQCSLETMFDRQKTICSNIIESANKTVVDCTVFTDEDNSHAVSAVQKYSRLSQQFENLLICSLILLDKNSQMSIDKLPDTMQPIKDLHQTLVSSLEHTLLPVNNCLDSVMDDIKRLSDEDALNCEDAANHLNCTIDRAEIQTKTNTDSSIEEMHQPTVAIDNNRLPNSPMIGFHTMITSIAIPDIKLPPGTVFTCTVQSLASLTSYVIQPYDEELAKVSEDLRHYGYREQGSYSTLKNEFLIHIVANTVCCAKFSADNSWYRARVVSKVGDEVVVLFVDFGNQEVVPLSPSHILPLPPLFTTLPAQAITCSLREKSSDIVISVTDPYSQIVYNWLATLLYTTMIEVQVCSCDYWNTIVADVFVPNEILLRQEFQHMLSGVPVNMADIVPTNEGLTDLFDLLLCLRCAILSLDEDRSVLSREDMAPGIASSSIIEEVGTHGLGNDRKQAMDLSYPNVSTLSCPVTPKSTVLSPIRLEMPSPLNDCNREHSASPVDCNLPCDTKACVENRLEEKETGFEIDKERRFEIDTQGSLEEPLASLSRKETEDSTNIKDSAHECNNDSPPTVIHSSPLKYTNEVRNLLFQNISKITSPSQDSYLSTSTGEDTTVPILVSPNSIDNSSIDSLSHCEVVDKVDSTDTSAKRKLTFVSNPDNFNRITALATKVSNTSKGNVSCSSSDIEYSTTEVTVNDHKSHSTSESNDEVSSASIDVSSQQSNPSLSSEILSNTSASNITQNLCTDEKDDSIEQIHCSEASIDLSLPTSQPLVVEGNIIPSYQPSNALSRVTTAPATFTLLDEPTNHFPSLGFNPGYNIPAPIVSTPLYLPCVPFMCAYMYDSNGCLNCPELGSGARLFPGSGRVYRDSGSPHGMIVLPVLNTSLKSHHCEEILEEQCDEDMNDANSIAIAPSNDVESLVANKNTCSEDCMDETSSQDIETPSTLVIPDPAHLSNDVQEGCEAAVLSCPNEAINEQEVPVVCEEDEHSHLNDNELISIEDEGVHINDIGSQDKVIEQANLSNESINSEERSVNHTTIESSSASISSVSVDVTGEQLSSSTSSSSINKSNDVIPSQELISDIPESNIHAVVNGSLQSILNGDVHTIMECDYEDRSMDKIHGDIEEQRDVLDCSNGLPSTENGVDNIRTCEISSQVNGDKIHDDIEEQRDVLDCSNGLPSTENGLDKCEISPEVNDDIEEQNDILNCGNGLSSSENGIDNISECEISPEVETPPNQDNECLSRSNASPVHTIVISDVHEEKTKQVSDEDDDVIDLLLDGLATPSSDCSDYSDSEVTIVPPPPDFGDDVMVTCDGVYKLKGIKMDQTMPMDISACSPSSEIVQRDFYHCTSVSVDDESQFHLVVSHVESPSLFYVFPIDQVASTLYILESDLFTYYDHPCNCISIDVSRIVPDTPCCVRNVEKGVVYMYRGLIVSDCYETSKCSVLCVDYGWRCVAALDDVFELDRQFFNVPVLVTACSLFGVTPKQSLGSTSDREKACVGLSVVANTSQWSQEATDRLSAIVHDKVLVGVVYENNKSDHDIYLKHSVLLYDTNRDEDTLINYQLVESGLACLLVSEEKAAFFNFGADNCAGSVIDDWNPMESDYLNSRNTYNVNDEDIGSATLGQGNSTKPLCKFYNTLLGCYRDRCPYRHQLQSVDDSVKDSTVYATPTVFTLPLSCVWVMMLVCGVSLTNRFMGLVVGIVENTEVKCSDNYIEFMALLKAMNSLYSSNESEYQLSSPPNPGQMVVIWTEDNYWYRSIVIEQQAKDMFKVFYIDVGYEDIVSFNAMRSLCPQFIHVSSQAVECCLSNTIIPKDMPQQIRDKGKQLVCKLTSDKILLAKICHRGSSVLYVELFQSKQQNARHKSCQSLNSYLVTQGYLSGHCGVGTAAVDNSSKVVLTPG